MKRRIYIGVGAAVLCAALGVFIAFFSSQKKAAPAMAPASTPERYDTVTISVAGDCTIGSDPRFSYAGGFHEMADTHGYAYFFSGVREIFSEDDITFVNLEGTLTNAEKAAEKAFAFRGKPAYTEILEAGNIDVVSLANNHSYDFLEDGFSDTKESLDRAGIAYAYSTKTALLSIKDGNAREVEEKADGVHIGIAAFSVWYDDRTVRQNIEKAILQLKNKGADLVFVSLHWGMEGENKPIATQKDIGRYAIDCGADGVWGHHPHVLQGIETYKGKEIVYSLGNFCFGGNHNPRDKDTMIYQMEFETKNGELTGKWESRILPASISSSDDRNDYRPRLLEGEAAEKVKERIRLYSTF